MIDDFRPFKGQATNSAEQKPTIDTLPPLDFNASATTVPEIKDEVNATGLEEMLGEPQEPIEEDNVKSKKLLARLPRPSWWHHFSKRQHILIIVASLLVLSIGSGSAAYFVVQGHKPKATAIALPKKQVKKAPVITTVASTLTGLQVDPSVNKRPVTAIMIENSPDARPQSGLDQAGVVFEAIAEGGITRFLTLYQDSQPDYIGPVRSVRPYYEQWALGFDAPIAHVGGSPESLVNINVWGIKDLDQFYNSGAYQRVSTRAAPHNVYTSIANLNEIEAKKGYTSSTFIGFARKAEQPYKAPVASNTKTTTPSKTTPDSRTVANGVNLNISSSLYNVHYDYDASTNSYKRTMAGQPHIVVNGAGVQTQVTPKVVVALVMSYSIQSDGKHSVYGTIGTGQLFVFQDGTVTPGTWSKADNKSQFQFADNDGHPLTLNPGQTWLTAIGSAGNVTYQ
jgi:hypothetical protein